MTRESLKLSQALFTFLDVEDIEDLEPTNNAAERALRPLVLWRRGAGECIAPRAAASSGEC